MANPIQKSMTEVTLEEFSDFLTRKNISSRCQRCNTQALQVNMEDRDTGESFVRVIQSPIVLTENSVFPFYMRVCANCASVESYGALLTLEDIQKQRSKDINKVINEADNAHKN